MIVTEILGNLADLEPQAAARAHLERVRLPLDALARRVQRVTGDHGTEVGLRLAPGVRLRDGDILSRSGDSLIVVALEASDVLVIAPASIQQMGAVAHTLGNRHLQAQFFGPDEPIEGIDDHDGVMVIPYDHTAESYLRQAGVRYVRASRVMPVPFRHAEHTH